MMLHFLGDDLGLGLRLKTDSMSSRRASVFHPTTEAGYDKSKFDNFKKNEMKTSVRFFVLFSRVNLNQKRINTGLFQNVY